MIRVAGSGWAVPLGLGLLLVGSWAGCTAHPTTSPTADDPMADNPTADDPIAHDPTAHDPIADDPVADDPMAGDPAAGRAVSAGPSALNPRDPGGRPAGDPWPALEASIRERLEGFEGDVGVYVTRPGQGGEVAIRADERFPTASMIKVPIALALLQAVAAGTLDLDAKRTYSKARAYPGEDLTASLRDGSKVSLRKLLGLMLAYSDNTASLWCQELAGTGTAINAWLRKAGCQHTRMNSRTPGREADFKAFGWGQTSPREMARLLIRVRDRKAVRPDLDERLHRELCKSHWDREGLASIPPRVQVASKQGAVSHSRSEVLLVHAPAGDYVLCVITKNQRDRSWGRANAGYVLLRDLSRLCWHSLGKS